MATTTTKNCPEKYSLLHIILSKKNFLAPSSVHLWSQFSFPYQRLPFQEHRPFINVLYVSTESWARTPQVYEFLNISIEYRVFSCRNTFKTLYHIIAVGGVSLINFRKIHFLAKSSSLSSSYVSKKEVAHF